LVLYEYKLLDRGRRLFYEPLKVLVGSGKESGCDRCEESDVMVKKERDRKKIGWK